MAKKILITGGAGFIGSHFVLHLWENTDFEIIILDKLTYASNGLKRIKHLMDDRRVRVFTIDLAHPLSVGIKQEIGRVDYIVHMAAETHVDNSIAAPVHCIQNNVMSTLHILEFAREQENLKLFFNFSTDEVYGPAPMDKLYRENDRHNPTNPYSASKSAGESICKAYENTYKIPLITVNSMNVIGESQHVEKFVPLTIKKLIDGEKVSIHSDSTNKIPGSRFYTHAYNIADAILFLINNGVIGETYHIVGQEELDNLTLARYIAKKMDIELDYELVGFHPSRPGHDLRYGLDGTKLHDLGWRSPINFYESLDKTIEFYKNDQSWLI